MDNLFDKWKNGLDRTRKVTFGRIATLFGASEITADTWEELEAMLVQADLGLDTTEAIIKSLTKMVEQNGFTRTSELSDCLRQDLLSRLLPTPDFDLTSQKPSVILLVGVNGSGKTTTAAKLSKQFIDQHKKVLLGAADTFRAAAVDQLQVWGDRLKVPVITGQPNADPGAVAYDAV
ncbi:MAG: signal recognition particle receptor subunit alpha, partial [Anaerolineae bacterium]|nr:signal recognition particle receptor subunit alpha [Anaerolineae bacterium]